MLIKIKKQLIKIGRYIKIENKIIMNEKNLQKQSENMISLKTL